MLLDDILSGLPDEFNMHDVQQKVPADQRTPYTIVAFQECERMNLLTLEIRRSLQELDLGLKVSLDLIVYNHLSFFLMTDWNCRVS